MNMSVCFLHPAYSYKVRELRLAADAPVPEKIDAMDAMQWTDDARDKEELRLRLFLAFQFF